MSVFVVDGGHGGYDPGASANGLIEKEWALEVSRLIKSNLEFLGHMVLMTRDSDVFVSLNERSRMSNNWKPDAFVSVHFNAGKGLGYEDFIYNDRPSQKTQNLQESVHNEVKDILGKHGLQNRGKKRANFAVLRGTAASALLIEGAFCDSSDYKALKSDAYKKDLAKAIAVGLDKFVGGNGKVIQTTKVASAQTTKKEDDKEVINLHTWRWAEVHEKPSFDSKVVNSKAKGSNIDVNKYAYGDKDKETNGVWLLIDDGKKVRGYMHSDNFLPYRRNEIKLDHSHKN